MKAAQYKAIRAAGVSEFAVWPVDIASELPWAINNANKDADIRACPRNLVKAVVVKDDVGWKEGFTLGCGDTEYARERRGGVLVQVPLEEFQAATEARLKRKVTLKLIRATRRTQILRHDDGTRHVEMIVSKLAIMSPWGEYAMIEAERQKSDVESEERKQRLNAAVEAIGARDGGFVEVTTHWDEKTKSYLPPDPNEYDYSVRYDGRRGATAYLRGSVYLTLTRAEEIAALLQSAQKS